MQLSLLQLSVDLWVECLPRVGPHCTSLQPTVFRITTQTSLWQWEDSSSLGVWAGGDSPVPAGFRRWRKAAGARLESHGGQSKSAYERSLHRSNRKNHIYKLTTQHLCPRLARKTTSRPIPSSLLPLVVFKNFHLNILWHSGTRRKICPHQVVLGVFVPLFFCL